MRARRYPTLRHGCATVAIVPHTHWDREWYAPFQTFRLRLVDLLDEFLPALEADPSYARFLLDGQMAVVDDYLAVRPEAEAALRRLAGRAAWRWGRGTSSWTSSSSRARPSSATCSWASTGPPPSAAPCRWATCPTCSATSPRCRSSCARPGFEHAVVWRGVPGGDRPHRVLVDGARRLDGAGRVPAPRLRQRRRHPRRRQGAAAPHRATTRPSWATPLLGRRPSSG